jgi:hypothetical protein
LRPKGLLYVLSEPGSVDEVAFHDWYNHEHGPARMLLSGVPSGIRYRAVDDLHPTWMALYELPLDLLESAQYLELLANRSERERKILAGLALLDRRVYELSATLGRAAIEEPAPYLVSVESDQDLEREQLDDRGAKVQATPPHQTLLHELPGWRRTRRFELKEGSGMQSLVLHEFATQSALGTPEFARAINSQGHNEETRYQRPHHARRYELYHTFSASDFDRQATVGDPKS